MSSPGSRAVLCALLAGLLAGSVVPGQARTEAKSPVLEAWRERLDEGRDRVQLAHVRLESARDTYQDWRQRKYPRGTHKADLVRQVQEATVEVEEAETAWVQLFEQARSAGVPPGVLGSYE
jgi:hypothetical protein